ncbi:MAG: hypothetical protein KC656_36305, partial [Myxococcales bacterium]|nr:hypothetical protein [Myxococcales bacterium]
DADHIVRNFTLLGTCTGFSLGVALSPNMVWPVVVVSVFATGFGYIVGVDRARTMRMDAQMALLHSAVERNTRAWLAESRLTLRGLGDAVDRMNRALELGVVAPAPGPVDTVAPPPVARRNDKPVQAVNSPADDGAPDEVLSAVTAQVFQAAAPAKEALDPREFDDSGFYESQDGVASPEAPTQPDEERA